MEPVLDYVVSNYSQIIQHAGSTWSKRLLRPFWELSRTVMAMFVEAPLLSMFVIGLPASVLSIVCYCICCLPNETMMNDEVEMVYRQAKEDENLEDDDDDDNEDDEFTVLRQTDDQPKAMSEKKEE